jgi:uncharacterized membrane protein
VSDPERPPVRGRRGHEGVSLKPNARWLYDPLHHEEQTDRWMTAESRHLWQQVVIMACRAGAAAAFSIWLIKRADSLADWKAVLGIVLLVVALLDLGSKVRGLRHARRTEA